MGEGAGVQEVGKRQVYLGFVESFHCDVVTLVHRRLHEVGKPLLLSSNSLFSLVVEEEEF